jgi:2-hydroxychromene-2-carboxylate isomerase
MSFYFSFRSPYSWMASRLLEDRLPEAPELMEYVPFFVPDRITLDMMAERGVEVHYTDMSKAKHLYILQDAKRLCARFGFTMAWPIDVDPWWVLPHHAWMAAQRIGKGRELFWALSQARWERGEDICLPDVVRKAGESVGIDGDLLVSAPDDPDLRRQGVDALERAYMDDVFGIPFFKIGVHKFWGIDRLDDYLALVEQKLAKGESR